MSAQNRKKDAVDALLGHKANPNLQDDQCARAQHPALPYSDR